MIRYVKHKWFVLKCNYPLAAYKFRHWFFKWNQDDEGDIVFSIAGLVHFLKYKEHTHVYWGKKNYKEAPKWVNRK